MLNSNTINDYLTMRIGDTVAYQWEQEGNNWVTQMSPEEYREIEGVQLDALFVNGNVIVANVALENSMMEFKKRQNLKPTRSSY